MQNYLQRGEALDVAAPAGGVVSGQAVAVGKLFGVASTTTASGSTVTLALKGIFLLSKTNAQAWAVGDALYWDNTNGVVTNVNSGSLLPVGYAAAAAANPSSVGQVLLARIPS